jgi:hypothetical protein
VLVEGNAVGSDTEDRDDPWLHPGDRFPQRCRACQELGRLNLLSARRCSRHQARDPDTAREEMLTICRVEASGRPDHMVRDLGEMQRAVEAIPSPGERDLLRDGCQSRVDSDKEQTHASSDQV